MSDPSAFSTLSYDQLPPFTSSYLKSAAVPMWAVYQFLVSVVLLRILIVMMTITYRRIYDDLDKQWK